MIRRVFMAAVLTALLATLGYAQGGGGGGMGGGSRGGGGGQKGGGGGQMGRGRGPQVDKSDAIASELKLTPEQKTAMDAIMDQAQKQADPLLPQFVAVRKSLLALAADGKNTDEATKQLTALNAQMLDIEVGAFTKTAALLDAKQKAKAPRLFELIADMFLTQGGWHKSR
jgi:Spy/CpxP family protein refolding chaperone